MERRVLQKKVKIKGATGRKSRIFVIRLARVVADNAGHRGGIGE